MVSTFLVTFDKLNTAIAPVHRPIIKLPQYKEIKGAMAEAL